MTGVNILSTVVGGTLGGQIYLGTGSVVTVGGTGTGAAVLGTTLAAGGVYLGLGSGTTVRRRSTAGQLIANASLTVGGTGQGTLNVAKRRPRLGRRRR